MHASLQSANLGVLSPKRQATRRPADGPAPAMAVEPGPAMSGKETVIRLLKDALIKELISVIHYKDLSDGQREQQALQSAEFLFHAYEALTHAQRLAQRIAQLGGELAYSPNVLKRKGRATPQGPHDLNLMVQASASSDYRAIARYTEVLAQLDAQDVSTRRLLEEIVQEERTHAEELSLWLAS